jgi:hypothetical protein
VSARGVAATSGLRLTRHAPSYVALGPGDPGARALKSPSPTSGASRSPRPWVLLLAEHGLELYANRILVREAPLGWNP